MVPALIKSMPSCARLFSTEEENEIAKMVRENRAGCGSMVVLFASIGRAIDRRGSGFVCGYDSGGAALLPTQELLQSPAGASVVRVCIP